MSERTYAIKEIFRTIQGEGIHAGRAAVFLRFAGCNLWSGKPEDRERDAQRTGAVCPAFCDTDFVGGQRLTAEQIATELRRLGAGPFVFVVATGGEPLLQLDAPLLAAIHNAGARAHAETNGTIHPAPGVESLLDWICCSPKLPVDRLALFACSELKVVVPGYDPRQYEAKVAANHYLVQPEDGPDRVANLRHAVAFVQANPRWRLSAQVHKMIRVP